MADGLTVPFALAAGLTGAIAQTGIIVTAGLAEIAAGSIAMGLGGYLAAKSDAEHYAKEREREKREVAEIPHEEMREVAEVFQAYGLNEEETWPIVQALKRQPRNWVDFMMRFELGLEKPQPGRALTSALTIAGAYVAGGMIPLAPYIFSKDTSGDSVDARCVVDLRVCKRKVHRNAAGEERVANGVDRQRCGRRRLRHRAVDWWLSRS
jgi:VIT1/CCC1 family predicted Fe2+/Mn2+ transporter